MAYDCVDLIDLLIQPAGVALHLRDGEVPILETRGGGPSYLKPLTMLFQVEHPALKTGQTEEILAQLLSKVDFSAVPECKFGDLFTMLQ